MAGPDLEDQGKWRATYGIAYPSTVVDITNAARPQEIMSRKVRFMIKKKSLEKYRFTTCQFLIESTRDSRGGAAQSTNERQIEINSLTFRGCHFDRTFLGGVAYVNCRFVDCTFQSCDFGGSKFPDCEFSDCRFTECTSWDTFFTRTTVDAAAFMRGQCVPLKHFQSAPQEEIDEARRKFYRSQSVIANQLVGSLMSGNQSDFYDGALYYAKMYDFHVRRSQLSDWSRYRRLAHSQFGATRLLSRDLLRMLFLGTNLLLTKGGTSVIRLLIAFAMLNVFLFPYLVLPALRLKYGGETDYCQEAAYHRRVLTSVEIFLTFGYTNYAPQNDPSHIAMVCYACSGIVWYAFLIPVLLRRIYK